METVRSAVVGVKARKQRCQPGPDFSSFVVINKHIPVAAPSGRNLQALPEHKTLSHPSSVLCIAAS